MGKRPQGFHISRRTFLGGAGALLLCPDAYAAEESIAFIFISDVHACVTGAGLSPNCQEEGKTDASLLRHVAALNALPARLWPGVIDGVSTQLPSAGKVIGEPRGVIVGGDMTDDGGGQTAERSEGAQILQFSHRYQQGAGPDRIHFPVYAGLGNHDLDQDGKPPDIDWYRNELRDYVRLNHEPSVFFKAPVPAAGFDEASDSYAWDWGPLHLVQLHRFGGDTRKGAAGALGWLKADLAANAANGRPLILFQHYGWDAFSTERWDPAKHTFDD
ncbi:metallophosphoesterase, partial [Escherichia coli]|nr:metallophosphoesterase [Escherichia coli]